LRFHKIAGQLEIAARVPETANRSLPYPPFHCKKGNEFCGNRTIPVSRRKEEVMSTAQKSPSKERVNPALATPTDLKRPGVNAICAELRQLLADAFALYVKTKNFHWHMSGAHFRDYHLLLDEHSDQIFAMTDDIAERARKMGGTTLHSIGDISRHQRLKDNDEEFVEPEEMLAELSRDNQMFTQSLRATHDVCDEHRDVATASLIENWIDETERRTWFLSEIVGPG
jgi:starvation-inducible DNA-binding protein